MQKLFILMIGFYSFLPTVNAAVDWHTQSNYQQVISTHIELDLTVDFQHKQLKGFIEHQIKRIDPKASILALDSRGLTILKVEIFNPNPIPTLNKSQKQNQWQSAPFKLAEADPIRGRQLSIKLKPETQRVRVHYHTNPDSTGLQWLGAEQTAGKNAPFMYSQSQAIHARSWMPIQDTPAMRVTYNAKITTRKNLRAVMSADNADNKSADGIYRFNMPQPIPAYLIAIAVGDLERKAMSAQTAIYAEKAYLDIAAKEFKDTQAMIDAASKLFGDYRWERYDLLILPPSFPFGGMENPRLSFITPTVLAGDKSLVSLIAHELAHSWSGNLVTNASWRDLWLNEGFTSYVENRIMQVVYGDKRAVMEQALNTQRLQRELEELAPHDSALYIDLTERDPDEAFSQVPYVKGQLFLMFLEQRFGRERFDHFLQQYFNDHAFQSVDTEGFKRYLDKHLIKRYPGKVTAQEIEQWIYLPQIPADFKLPTSNAFVKIHAQIDQWLAGQLMLTQLKTNQWTVHEWLYFINHLPQDISLERMMELDAQFKLTATGNNEIAHAWLLLGINREYTAINKRLENYLVTIGRQILIRPLYEALLENKNSADFARQIYKKARPGYHPMTQNRFDEMFAGHQ